MPVNYLQTDNRWGGIPYAVEGEKSTIAKAGCGPTCVAMVLATLVDPNITPRETCKWAVEHGYKALRQGTYYTYISAHLVEHGIHSTRLNTNSLYGQKTQTAKKIHQRALDAIKNDKWVIACMGAGNWTSSGHYVLWHGINGIGEVMIRDPNSLKPHRIRNKLKTFQDEVKYYWVIDTPEEADEVIETRNITILGKRYKADGIFKKNRNYITPKVFKDAGFDVNSQGSEPIISMPTITVNIDGADKVITGINSNGTAYCGIRQLAELLGYEVSFEQNKIILK